MGTPLLFFGSERVGTETASEQPTGHSGLRSKAEEKGFKVSSRFHCTRGLAGYSSLFAYVRNENLRTKVLIFCVRVIHHTVRT